MTSTTTTEVATAATTTTVTTVCDQIKNKADEATVCDQIKSKADEVWNAVVTLWASEQKQEILVNNAKQSIETLQQMLVNYVQTHNGEMDKKLLASMNIRIITNPRFKLDSLDNILLTTDVRFACELVIIYNETYTRGAFMNSLVTRTIQKHLKRDPCVTVPDDGKFDGHENSDEEDMELDPESSWSRATVHGTSSTRGMGMDTWYSSLLGTYKRSMLDRLHSDIDRLNRDDNKSSLTHENGMNNIHSPSVEDTDDDDDDDDDLPPLENMSGRVIQDVD
jgi:hypothetical protein